MKTIIQGNKDVIKRIKYFQCKTCGWAGSAEEGEYNHGPQWEPGCYVKCPCCKYTANEVTDPAVLHKLITQEKNHDLNYWANR